jgi:hypothetical protein
MNKHDAQLVYLRDKMLDAAIRLVDPLKLSSIGEVFDTADKLIAYVLDGITFEDGGDITDEASNLPL